MTTNQLLGVILIATGFLDAVLGVAIPRRLPDPTQRRVMTVTMIGASVALIVLGLVFLLRSGSGR
jgi:hypothetical protein